MIYCKIENGVVVDRALFEGEMPLSWPEFNGWVPSDHAQIGWEYVEQTFISPPPADVPPAPSPYTPLAPYQFWTAVRATNHEADLLAWVGNIPNPLEKAAASSMLEFSLEYRREHPFMVIAGEALGMTPAELDTLWLWAKTL